MKERTDIKEKSAIKLLIDNVCLQHLIIESSGSTLCGRHLGIGGLVLVTQFPIIGYRGIIRDQLSKSIGDRAVDLSRKKKPKLLEERR